VLEHVEIFRSELSQIGGSAGVWRCCWAAPSLSQLPPATTRDPPPFINLILCFVLEHVEIFRSELSQIGGSAGVWRCCWAAPSLSQLPPATTRDPPPFINLILCYHNIHYESAQGCWLCWWLVILLPAPLKFGPATPNNPPTPLWNHRTQSAQGFCIAGETEGLLFCF